MSTMWLWVLAVLLLVGADLLLAPTPTALALERPPVGSVRLGEPTATVLVATNGSRRRLRGVVRDAWQPTAGASGNRHRLSLGAGDRAVLTSALEPRRRGDLRAIGVTV